MKKFTITRSNWLCGEGGRVSFLLRSSDGKKCCLGQYATACGIPDKNIINIQTPLAYDDFAPVVDGDAPLRELASEENEYIISQIMAINDGLHFGPVREDRLIEEFKRLGIEVDFVD